MRQRFATLSAVLVSALTLAGCAPVAPDGDGTVVIEVAIEGTVADAVKAQISAAATAAELTVEFRDVPALSVPTSEADDVVSIEADIVLTDSVAELTALASSGALTPITSLPGVDPETIYTEVGPYWASLTADAEGESFGFPLAASLASVTFMNPLAFTEQGYTVPTTSAEFEALVDRIESDNSGFPWCAGMENGDLTGDPFIDWLAEFVLATGGSELYRSWLAGETQSDSPEIAAAAEAARDTIANHSVAKGDSAALLSVGFANTVPLFDLVGTYGKQCFFIRERPDYVSFMTDVVTAEVAAGSYRQVSAFPFFGAGDTVVVTPIVDAVFAGVGHVDKDVEALVMSMGAAPFGDSFAPESSWVSARPESTDDRPGPFVAVNRTVLGVAPGVELSPRSVMSSDRLEKLRAAAVSFLSGDAEWAEAAANVE